MSRIGVLVWRKIFESGDAKRIAKQKQDTGDLVLHKDIPYRDDDDRGICLTSIGFPARMRMLR
ncbi:MAG: hypothetical protein IJ246_10765 [Clostridia bacterium]|nr:hypothetical protein [Clostridia bacterium]